MPNTLVVAFLAGALALAGVPASGLELPDYGSKNFSPSSDTPAYFTNEAAPVAARTGDTTANDWSAVDAEAPEPSLAASPTPSRGHSGRHGRQASSQRSAKHIVGKPRSAYHSAHSARLGGNQTVVTSPSRKANRESTGAANVKGSARTGSVKAAKTTTAKQGKSAARHVRAEAGSPSAGPGVPPL
jgi:hypothetical protein